jgi:hypothetical protein
MTDEVSVKKSNWFGQHKVLTALLVFALLIGFLMILGSGSQSSNPTPVTNQPTSTATPVATTLKVTSVQLSTDYSDNQVAADAKYKGNVAQISGLIQSIGKDITNTPYVTLAGPATSLFGVQCMFSKSDETQLATLAKGHSVTVQGTVSGSLIGDVVVNGCSLVK